MKESPYQQVFNEKDKLGQITQAFTFLNGDTLTTTESKTLQNSQLPGVNQRYGMPAKPPVHQAQRESDLSAILSFCSLPPSETKRALVLRACEQMMKGKEPEREFSFLDRNFVEKYDQKTLRQQLAFLLRFQPDLAYTYYPNEDALLLAVYFKNPPGRLLRRQWSHQLRVAPDFNQWKSFVKQGIKFDGEDLIDIEPSKVGVIRTNTKYGYPCDNSLIRVEKLLIGGRRLGSTLVLKDNLAFGIKERADNFKAKQSIDEEDILRNRELWSSKDLEGRRRCDFWLEFENGVKMLVEMADEMQATFQDIPL